MGFESMRVSRDDDRILSFKKDNLIRCALTASHGFDYYCIFLHTHTHTHSFRRSKVSVKLALVRQTGGANDAWDS